MNLTMQQMKALQDDLEATDLINECREVVADHHEFVYGSEEDSLLMYPDRKGEGSGECFACEDNWPCWAVRVSKAYIGFAEASLGEPK